MKQYFTGFFTAVCLTTSAFIFMGSQNKNLGNIEVDSITLIGELGYTLIAPGVIATKNKDGQYSNIIGVNDAGHGFIRTCNADGKEMYFHGSGNDGGGGFVETYNAYGKKISILGIAKSGGGILSIFNSAGDLSGYLQDHLQTYNVHGLRTGYFGTSKDNDGMITIMDRYGDIGWSQSGKQ